MRDETSLRDAVANALHQVCVSQQMVLSGAIVDSMTIIAVLHAARL